MLSPHEPVKDSSSFITHLTVFKVEPTRLELSSEVYKTLQRHDTDVYPRENWAHIAPKRLKRDIALLVNVVIENNY